MYTSFSESDYAPTPHGLSSSSLVGSLRSPVMRAQLPFMPATTKASRQARKKQALDKLSIAMETGPIRMRSVDLFNALDLNKNGLLTRIELERGLKKR